LDNLEILSTLGIQVTGRNQTATNKKIKIKIKAKQNTPHDTK